jgi:hypothetical protein
MDSRRLQPALRMSFQLVGNHPLFDKEGLGRESRNAGMRGKEKWTTETKKF